MRDGRMEGDDGVIHLVVPPRDAWDDIQALGAVVLGVSPDDGESHRRFADKYRLPFRLLSDGDRSVGQAYETKRAPEERGAGFEHSGGHRRVVLGGGGAGGGTFSRFGAADFGNVLLRLSRLRRERRRANAG